MIYHTLKDDYCITTLARDNADILCDVLRTEMVRSIDVTKYDVIINCIGLLVKESNANFEKAILINSWLPNFLASKTQHTNTRVIHLSTDCVFSGKGVSYGYFEDSPKDGLDFYSKSKSMGEIVNQKDLTIRLSIIGPELKNGTGLLNWFLRQHGPVKGYSGAIWNGITTLELAKVMKDYLNGEQTGLINIGSEPISKYNLLSIMNTVWNKNLEITPDDNYRVNKTLHSNIITYKAPSHFEMLTELKEFMDKSGLYNY